MGVFLCEDCAGIHRSYGLEISTIRSPTLDAWTKRDLKALEFGGNQNLAEYFDKYDLWSEQNTYWQDMRYFTIAADFYRKKLQYLSKDKKFDFEPPPYSEGRKLIDDKYNQSNQSEGDYSYSQNTRSDVSDSEYNQRIGGLDKDRQAWSKPLDLKREKAIKQWQSYE